MKLVYRKHPNNVLISEEHVEVGSMVRYRYLDKSVLNYLTQEERASINGLEDSDKFIHIHSISVRDEFKVKGYLSDILSEFEKDMKTQGYISIMSFADSSLFAELEKLGYKEINYLESCGLHLVRKDLD